MAINKLFNVILIETKNECTRKCWFCKFGQARQDKVTVKMDWHIVERIISNLSDLNYSGRISWFWINEPLMEKRMLEILKLTRSKCPRAFLSLITNGDLLNKTVYRSLRKAGMDALGVSVYDDKTFNKIEKIMDKRIVTFDMRNISANRLENRGGNIKKNAYLFEEGQQQLVNKSCNRPFSMMTINPKGQVVLCCSDMYSDVVMGDVKKQRLEEIWNNKLYEHYRNTLSNLGRKGLKLCDGCSHNGNASGVFYPLQKKPKLHYLEGFITTIRGILGLDISHV